MEPKTSAFLITLGMLVGSLATLPAASADTTYECALDPAPPCVRVIHGDTTGDGDCDASNGAGSQRHAVDVWTGANPAGNQSVSVVNSCGSYRELRADVTYLLPLHRFSHWISVAWYDGGTWCFAAAWTGGRGNPVAVTQDLGAVACEIDGPPMLP